MTGLVMVEANITTMDYWLWIEQPTGLAINADDAISNSSVSLHSSVSGSISHGVR
jgi:hypothetical protein